MPNRIANERQYALTAVQKTDYSDFATPGLSTLTVELPPGAVIVGGGILVVTASNAAGAATLSVGITGGSATAFLPATGIKAAGYTAFSTGVGTYLPNGGSVSLTSALTTGATAGEVQVLVNYVVLGRGNEVQ